MEETGDLCPGCMKPKGDVETCPHCGFKIEQDRNPQLLPYNTTLNARFLIGRVLGNPGGFGITYLAWDRSLHTRVAIKEFFPTGISVRSRENSTVRIEGGVTEADYRDGIRVFLEEARTLARFSHPNIARVRDFFEENNTAYLVMDFYDGCSLSEYLKRSGGTLSESHILNTIKPVLAGLKQIHDQGFLHRDIKPSNIQMTPDGTAVLLDFGSARQYMREKTTTLSVILTPGYSPVEQYYAKGEQGPWTDVYSVAASIYYLVTGTIPPSAIDRIHDDSLTPAIELNTSLSHAFSNAISKGMSIKPNNRPQNIDALFLLLEEDRTVAFGHTQHEPPRRVESQTSVVTTWVSPPGRGSSLKLTHVLSLLLLVIAGLILINTMEEPVAESLRVENDAEQARPVSATANATSSKVKRKRVVISSPPPPLSPEPAEDGAASVMEIRAVDETVFQPVTRQLRSPSSEQPIGRQQNFIPQQPQPGAPGRLMGANPPAPPQQAITACSGKGMGSSCSIRTPLGVKSGSCRQVPSGSVACIPDSHRGDLRTPQQRR